MHTAHTTGNQWRYGLLGLPLAFVSLPLYVNLPRHYAEHHAVPLATLGGLLLLTRLIDAVLDPRIGRWIDTLFARHPRLSWRAAALSAMAMALGFAALWAPPAGDQRVLLAWLAGSLMVSYVAYSVISVVHQAWGTRWGGNAQQRTRLFAWREGAALAGVLLASILPSWLGMQATSATLALALALGLWALHQTLPAQPVAQAAAPQLANASHATHTSPWRHQPFVILLVVFVFNGIASAIPATLLSFFVRDTLQAAAWEPLFLGSYFVAAAIGLPLWVRLVSRLGLANGWLLSMGMSVAAFCATPWLGPGDTAVFILVCILTGLALGADLAIPGALLTGVIHHAGRGLQDEGLFVGWWTAATKLNLALASGLALPLLAWAGFETGRHTPENQTALALAYGLLPCGFKLLAALCLLAARKHHPILRGLP